MHPSEKSSAMLLHLCLHNLDSKKRLLLFFTKLILNQLHDVSVTTAFYTSITMSYMDCAI